MIPVEELLKLLNSQAQAVGGQALDALPAGGTTDTRPPLMRAVLPGLQNPGLYPGTPSGSWFAEGNSNSSKQELKR